MMLTQTTKDAIKLLAALGNGPVSSAEAHTAFKKPAYGKRVITMLARHGLVETTRGKNSSISLAKDPSETSIWDVAKVCQTLWAMGAPDTGDPGVIREIQEFTKEKLMGATIAHVIQEGRACAKVNEASLSGDATTNSCVESVSAP